jgi:hypothetical protein
VKKLACIATMNLHMNALCEGKINATVNAYKRGNVDYKEKNAKHKKR